MSDSMIGNLFAVGYGLLAGAFAFFIMHLPHTSPEYPAEGSVYAPTEWPPPEDTEAPQPTDGPGLYAANCVACHQDDGMGTPPSFPPLAGSEWVTGDPETPIRVALLGVTGPIEVKGEQFNNTMPQLVLTEEQIAKIVTHIRTSWGNSASEVTVEQVKKVKESLGGRSESWTAEELQALR